MIMNIFIDGDKYLLLKSLMLNKGGKKDLGKLRFDTSLDNLACFIKKKPKQQEGELSERVGKNNRRKNKPSRQKAPHFTNVALIESILANVFTEQIGGVQEIKKLVQDSQKADEQKLSYRKCKNRTLSNQGTAYLEENQSEEEEHASSIFSDETNYKCLVTDWPRSKKHITSTRVGTEQTLEHSFTEERPSKQNILPQTTSFQQSLYQYYYQPVERKKRSVTNEEATEFKIDLDNVYNDERTTLMIRNIPNKYTQELLLQELKNYRVKFDFFYLPIDYNNSCNVGYAFINFIHKKFIAEFHSEFHGRKWSKFNSEKICSLAYARLQGTSALKSHFRNSHVMQQKDKRFRPLIGGQLGQNHRNNLNRIIESQKYKI